jgi:hypothetical protein
MIWSFLKYLQVLSFMKEHRIAPDVTTYNIIIDSHRIQGNIDVSK